MKHLAIALLLDLATLPAQDSVRTPHDATVAEPTWWLELAGRAEPGSTSAPIGVLIRADGVRAMAAPNTVLPSLPGLSPDRTSQVMVVRERARQRDLVVRPVRVGAIVSGAEAGQARREVRLTSDHDNLDPLWSPDCSSIWFRSDRGGDGWQLWRIDAVGGDPERITSGVAKVHEARLSPDGSMVLLDRATARPGHPRDGMRTLDRDLTLLDLGTREERKLVEGAFTLDFAWSPDGSTVVCGADSSLMFVDVADGEVTRRIETASVDPAAYAHGAHGFVWRPDNGAVACKLSFLGQTLSLNGEWTKMFGADEVFVIGTDGSTTVLTPPKDDALRTRWTGKVLAWRRLPG